MSYWDNLSEKSLSSFTPAQFEAAAYRLVSEQAIYWSDIRSRVIYRVIEQFEREFKSVLAPLGVQVAVNRQLRYAYAIPTHEKISTASTEQTLLALVLRKIHDESARMGQFNSDGEVACDLIELTQKYQQLVNRELATGGRLEALLQTMGRWGIAKTVSDTTDSDSTVVAQPYVVMIRPAIVEILGETALRKLALHQQHRAPSGELDVNESGVGEDPTTALSESAER